MSAIAGVPIVRGAPIDEGARFSRPAATARTTQHLVGTGEAVESLFESERYPQPGLVLPGIPLLGTLFVVDLGAWSRRVRPGAGAYRGADTPD